MKDLSLSATGAVLAAEVEQYLKGYNEQQEAQSQRESDDGDA